MLPDSPLSALDSYAFDLPEGLIAQSPLERRDHSRMLVVGPENLENRQVRDLPDLLRAGDVVVLNDSRVMRARCGLRRASGGRVEVLFLEPGPGPVQALVRPSRRLSAGEVLVEPGGCRVRLLAEEGEGVWCVDADPSPLEVMDRVGQVPLPPYIRRSPDARDEERYQTVYSARAGSAAAPTAGLHLTREVLWGLTEKGVDVVSVTLHVGLGTFRPLRAVDLQSGQLHRETWSVPESTVESIRRARARGGRILAVGTTTVRALESATPPGQDHPTAGQGSTRLFIQEGYRFRSSTSLLTNFHLPRTSLLMLVAARVGRSRLLEAYAHAVREGYRFYSYGDAMLVL